MIDSSVGAGGSQYRWLVQTFRWTATALDWDGAATQVATAVRTGGGAAGEPRAGPPPEPPDEELPLGPGAVTVDVEQRVGMLIGYTVAAVVRDAALEADEAVGAAKQVAASASAVAMPSGRIVGEESRGEGQELLRGGSWRL